MIFIKVDFERQRLCLKTAICNNFIQHQVQVLLKTEETNFRSFKLSLKDVSYGNYTTYEVKELKALDEIKSTQCQLNNINYNFISAKIQSKKRKYYSLLKAGQDISDSNYYRFIFPRLIHHRRRGTEKICAMLSSAMNDFNFLRTFVQSIYAHPNVDRMQLDPLWDEINDCLYDLLETEYKTLDPFFIRRQIYRLHQQFSPPDNPLDFDHDFYKRVPNQKMFLTNSLIQQERIRYSSKIKPTAKCRFRTYEQGAERFIWEDESVWNVE